jgi:hypothetical protein
MYFIHCCQKPRTELHFLRPVVERVSKLRVVTPRPPAPPLPRKLRTLLFVPQLNRFEPLEINLHIITLALKGFFCHCKATIECKMQYLFNYYVHS